MTIRIYALAQELNIESKVLIDLCQQLGIINKAAALTNLTDDDVEKIKEYLARHPKKTAVDFAASVNNAPIPPGGVAPDLTQPKLKDSAKSKTSASAVSTLTANDIAKIKAYLKQQSSKKESCSFPIRIYALAQELNIESKVLIDLCQLLGIKNKVAALKNLTADDFAKIKEYIEQQSL